METLHSGDILCFCGPQVWGNTQYRTMAANNSITTTTLSGIPKKRKVFFFKTLQTSALHNLSERKMGAQPGGQLGQVHGSRWCQNHGKTRQKNSLLQGVILYHTAPLMYQGLSSSMNELRDIHFHDFSHPYL